jgi:uncharacterized protein (TIGR02466 family)
MIRELYPTKVKTFSSGFDRKRDAELSMHMLGLVQEYSYPVSMYEPVGGVGYHTKFGIEKLPWMSAYNAMIREKMSDFYIELHGGLGRWCTLFYSWGMVYGKGAYTQNHVHPGATLSSAYYCSVPRNMRTGDGDLRVHDPRPAAAFEQPNASDTIIHIPAHEGEGHIFPGWLSHDSTPHYTEEPRIAIVTNMVIKPKVPEG